MRQVILDTNFLLIPGQFKIDIFEELQCRLDFPFELCIVEETLFELDKIIEKDKNKHKIAAEIAKSLIKAKHLKILSSEGKIVDDRLVKLSKNSDVVVATQDKELRKRLNGPKILLRQKKYIQMVE